MASNSGTKLGPCEVQSPLGAGGMGAVYRARDTRLDRTVAIKIQPERLSSNLEAKQRFEREARAISSLNHPNICTLHDVGHQDGTDFLVMEFLEGETLADRLRKGPLPLKQVLKVGTEICEGLEKAHRRCTFRLLSSSFALISNAGARSISPDSGEVGPVWTRRKRSLGISRWCSHPRCMFTDCYCVYMRYSGHQRTRNGGQDQIA